MAVHRFTASAHGHIAYVAAVYTDGTVLERWSVGGRSWFVVTRGTSAWTLPAVGAAAWCAAFAAVHAFWAAGGTTGLASAAGSGLTAQRPTAFVMFGLFGVAVLLLAGIVLVMTASGVVGTVRLSRHANVVVAVVGSALVIRGLAVEVLLGADIGGLRTSVGPLESAWSLALWNPWFTMGGGLFLWTFLRVRRIRRRFRPSQ